METIWPGMKRELIDAAAGRIPAELVLRGAQVLCVFTGEWQQADVAICQGMIVGVGNYRGEQEIDLSGRWIVPGLIDAHMHIESSMVTPRALAQIVAPHGTTTLIADPHEIANVCGRQALDYLLEQCREAACNIFVMLPSCVPATPFEDNGATLTAEDLAAMRGQRNVLGLGEMMNYVGVVNNDDEVHRKLAAFSGGNIDGHAPLLSGRALQAYRLSGVRTEHECAEADETLEKLRAGFFLLAREGSGAKNLETVLSAVQQAGVGYDRLAFCTDDKHIEEIEREGHIDHMVRKAIALGVPAVQAYRMASWNAAQCYGLQHLGAVAAGYQADLLVLSDPEQVSVCQVYHRGVPVQRAQEAQLQQPPEPLLHTVRPAAVSIEQLQLPLHAKRSPVIELVPHQIATRLCYEELPQRDGLFCADHVYQKLAVFERHHASGRIGLGVVRGFGLHGAVASTVAHDSHNLIVVGDNDEDMLRAVEELCRCQGGYTAVQNGTVLETLPLPVCGLMTGAPAGEVRKRSAALAQALRQMGIAADHDPFQTLSFLSLPVIPEVRLTDRGLFDSVFYRFLTY